MLPGVRDQGASRDGKSLGDAHLPSLSIVGTHKGLVFGGCSMLIAASVFDGFFLYRLRTLETRRTPDHSGVSFWLLVSESGFRG